MFLRELYAILQHKKKIMLTACSAVDFVTRLADTKAGVMLFQKKLCPHCKNMEKALERFTVLAPEAELYSVDLEENPDLAAQYGAQRAPTLLVVRNGIVTGCKAGLMNPREILAFYQSV